MQISFRFWLDHWVQADAHKTLKRCEPSRHFAFPCLPAIHAQTLDGGDDDGGGYDDDGGALVVMVMTMSCLSIHGNVAKQFAFLATATNLSKEKIKGINRGSCVWLASDIALQTQDTKQRKETNIWTTLLLPNFSV